MTVSVRLFASLRETAGTDRAAVDLPDGSSVEDLWPRLVERFPRLEGRNASLAWAVNHAYVKPSHRLSDGDEVAAMPPISGGSA